MKDIEIDLDTQTPKQLEEKEFSEEEILTSPKALRAIKCIDHKPNSI